MALNKDTLGTALYNRANYYNEVNIADLEAARLAFWKGVADEIINHFKTYGDLQVPGLGLTASIYPVVGNSTTGKIQ